MKLTIEIVENRKIEEYLALMTIGILSEVEKSNISLFDGMNLLFRPGLFEALEETMPEIAQALHLAAELDGVLSIIPDKYDKSVEDIVRICQERIQAAKEVKSWGKIKYILNDE